MKPSINKTLWVKYHYGYSSLSLLSNNRLVYRWFNFIYKISYGLGLAGYMIMMATVFGLNLLLLIRPEKCFDVGLLLIFYGLYYGVLGRDFAEICSESMASHIGVSSQTL